MALTAFPNYYTPFVQANGKIDDAWFRALNLFRSQLSTGFTVTAGPGIAVSDTEIGPGDNLTIGNTGVLSLTNIHPAEGIAISSTGLSGNIVTTFTLTDDLAGVEALTTFGLSARTGNSAWTTRVLTGTTNSIDIADGDGISGNPTFVISPTYPGQTSITTLGTISTGEWNGSIIPILFGGTGQSTATGAFNALAPDQTGYTGKYLRTDGSTTSWVSAVTSVAASVPSFLTVSGSPITSTGTLAISYSGTALPVLNGGTGVTTSTGTGSNVLSTSPALVTPNIGAASGTQLVTSGVISTSNGNIGAGIVSPVTRLQARVSGTTSATQFRLDNDTDTSYGQVQFVGSTFTTSARRNNLEFITNGSTSDITFLLNGVEKARFGATSGHFLITGATSALGYGTGAGGAVTQVTSRTTGVTLNKSTGAITLVSAAGSTSWQSFTVTNSTVAATDVVLVNQKSGADLYQIFVTAVSAGSFRISFATTGGTTTEQPVFNFVVIKAVSS